MKTPREILLGKHENIRPRLDALREEFAAELTRSQTERAPQGQPAPADSTGFGWRELLLIGRWHLASLGAVWILIATLRLTGGVTEAPRIAQAKAPSKPTVILTLKENRRQLLEFSGATVPSVSPVPPAVSPSRRSCREPDRAYS